MRERSEIFKGEAEDVMEANSQDRNSRFDGVPRWTLIVIGVLSGMLIVAGAMLLIPSGGSESNSTSAISASEISTTTSTGLVESTVPPTSTDQNPTTSQAPAPQAPSANRATNSATEPTQIQTSPAQNLPPQITPPQTTPPTTSCVPNASEVARLERDYARAQLNYSVSRRAAVYEGNTNAVRRLDSEYQSNIQQRNAASDDLNNCRIAYWNFTIVEY